jgi:acetyl esterase/lipase
MTDRGSDPRHSRRPWGRTVAVVVAVIAIGTVLGALAACGTDKPPTGSQPTTPGPVAPVADTTTADPQGGGARGTMIMVHGGGWAGHSAAGRDRLIANPGSLLLKLGWRIVSIDYAEGTAGLKDVLETIDSEVERKTGLGPMCLYGESSGAHLALIAASRRRTVDCVAGLGALTDLSLYERVAETSSDGQVRLLAGRIGQFFGTTRAALAPWDPISVARSIHADVLLMHEEDEPLVPATQARRFQAAHPATRVVELEAGDPADASTIFMHGSVSTRGREQYAAAIRQFVTRAVAARRAERRAQRKG